jgi:hypothetical protein
VVFDDPDLLRFGERLASVPGGFVAADATTWTVDGGPHEWSRVSEVLDALLAEGMLERIAD